MGKHPHNCISHSGSREEANISRSTLIHGTSHSSKKPSSQFHLTLIGCTLCAGYTFWTVLRLYFQKLIRYLIQCLLPGYPLPLALTLLPSPFQSEVNPFRVVKPLLSSP